MKKGKGKDMKRLIAVVVVVILMVYFSLPVYSEDWICECPESRQEVFYGVVSEPWITAIVVMNSTHEDQHVVLLAGHFAANRIVPAFECLVVYLADIVEASQYPFHVDTPDDGRYPITLQSHNGVEMVVYISDGVSFSIQR